MVLRLVKFSWLMMMVGLSLVAMGQKPYVLMISLDGFRWDYPGMVLLPTLDSLARTGVKATSLKPAFPSITFPNHYSMATGLYPDHHGIVSNSFYDSATKKQYAVGNRKAVEDGTFYGGEPIWVTAEKQGVISASFFWVGSEAPIQGIHPTYWKRYDEKISMAARGDSVVAWLSLPGEKRPHLVLLYYHEPDAVGHHAGPESADVRETIVSLDKALGDLFRKINELPIASQINVIVTSDHGMQPTSMEQSVLLTDYIQPDWFERIEGYGTNPRTLDFVLLADSGWTIRKNALQKVGKGAHGYDPDNRNMHAIFYASGPAFKKGYVSKGFNNVDLYPLLTSLLRLVPAPVDGTIDHVSDLILN
jgi:predicted AlkP superfamily pyrophosphatase or phosphodiesterase